MSITPSPKGFRFSVAEAAIKAPGRKDLALIFSDCEAAVAGVFTTNKVKAAPVLIDIEKARTGKGRAVVVNSGNANAATGSQGLKDAKEMAALAAKALGIEVGGVYVSSTGVIGVPMPMERVRAAVGPLCSGLGSATADDVSRAIMTTDSYPKITHRELKAGGKTGTITAMCKGAGMIRPDMATMLCYILTDLAIERKALHAALKAAADDTFNMLSVDGETSTNDTVLVFANGMAGNRPIKSGTADYRRFAEALKDICLELSRKIARDGEGATKLLEVEIEGAKTAKDARQAAMAVANSLLVKTAVYGNDPNWGRVISAIGASGVAMEPLKVDIWFGPVKVVSRGLAAGVLDEAQAELKKEHVVIKALLRMGNASARAISCDLTEEYIKINAEYTT